MEREKLRGISIIAAEAVDSSKSRGIAIPAVRAVVADATLLLTRSLSGTFSSAGSVPIRAPITIEDEDDDDDDSGSVTDERNLDAASYSKGIDSGTDDDDDDDDGFESVSGDADDEAELEGMVMDELKAHGVLGEESVGENGDGSDFSPLAGGDVEEEASVNYSYLEEEEEEGENSEVVSESEVSDADGDVTKAKVVIPRAILSFNDDDEVLGSSGDEEEAQVGDKTLQYGDKGMVDEPECSGSVLTDVVSTEDEAIEMQVTTDGLEDNLVSFGDIEDLSVGVPPGGSDDFMVQNEASIGLDGSSRQLFEEGVVHRTTIKEDGGGSIHESDALMKPGDVEGVEDGAVELGEREVTVLSEGSGSVTGELVSTEEDVVQVNLSDDASVSFETGLGVATGDCSEFVVESEGNAVEADEGLDETVSKLVEQGVGQESISNESDNKIDDGSACEADEVMIQGEGSIGLGSRESEDEDTGFMIGEAKELTENACSAVGKLKNPECEGEPGTDVSSESSQVTPTLDSAATRNLDVSRGIDVIVSGCDSSNQKADQEAENEGTQDSEDIDRKLSFPDEDRESSSSFEMANESVENGEQISEQIDKQVTFQPDSEPSQISVGIDETSLLDVERTMPEHSCVAANDVTENEAQISRLIHNHTCMELDECEGTGDKKEKLSESTFQNHSEELSQSLQLISGRVKERVEKTKLLKEKIQRIIKGLDLCNEDSAVTEVESQPSLVDEEHHTSLGLDHMDDGTMKKLPEQELPLGLDFSINVLVIGKTGVGKSATINSIFGETKSAVGAFRVTTKSANYVVGNVGGILIRILDTPGLMSSATEEGYNQDVLTSIKKSMRKFPVDVVLYIDRLDENPDVRLLRTITGSLGSSIWRNAIVVLTHAASSDVPDSASYTEQRSSLMYQSIRQAVPELSKMPGIVLAENNLCGNKTSESTCPDWRLNLLILCCSVKIRCKSGSLLVEKPDALGSSQLRSFTLFCSLWNVLLNQGHASQSFDDLEEKKRRLLESYPEILWDEQSEESLERQETLPVKNEEDEGRSHEKESVSRRRRRRGSLGFQATKRLGIYLDTSDLHTGFSKGSGGRRKVEQEEEGKMLVSVSVLGLIHVLTSVIVTCFYGRKDI